MPAGAATVTVQDTVSSCVLNSTRVHVQVPMQASWARVAWFSVDGSPPRVGLAAS